MIHNNAILLTPLIIYFTLPPFEDTKELLAQNNTFTQYR